MLLTGFELYCIDPLQYVSLKYTVLDCRFIAMSEWDIIYIQYVGSLL